MTNAFDKLNKAKTEKTASSFQTGTSTKGGRPKKTAADKRDSKVVVYFNSLELEQITKHCQVRGIQTAVYLRQVALSNIQEHNKTNLE